MKDDCDNGKSVPKPCVDKIDRRREQDARLKNPN